ncbi:rCG47713 [Rattus norvegicus]|uniref:RCG47713 n=1 Tax=Rattus norvegicus TaxID=10116 RepID=A6I143_RAT|nr:rCG47713 [Rattus norvegicus]
MEKPGDRMEDDTVFQPLLFPPTSCLSVVSHCGTREWDLKSLPYWNLIGTPRNRGEMVAVILSRGAAVDEDNSSLLGRVQLWPFM